MKVCFVIPSLSSGGAERVAATVLSALDADHERVLYLFSRERGVYFDRLAPGVEVVVAERRSWLPRLWELSRFLRRTRPDVVMAFLSYFITASAVSLARVPARVIFNQGTPTTGFLDDADFTWRRPWRRRLFAAVTRLFYNRADVVVVTSRGVADDLVSRFGVASARLRILHNPVDLESITRAAAEPVDDDLEKCRPLVVAAGRLARVKDYPLLLQALAQAATSRGTPHAWILGEGPERAGLERMATELGLTGRVRFLGFQANPWRFIARADVFVLTSQYEGFGNVVIEAMACGTPVVATRSPGTVEIISDGDDGLLVAHEPAAVAAAIARLVDDRALRDQVVARARAGVERYATPQVAARYEQVLREAVE